MVETPPGKSLPLPSKVAYGVVTIILEETIVLLFISTDSSTGVRMYQRSVDLRLLVWLHSMSLLKVHIDLREQYNYSDR